MEPSIGRLLRSCQYSEWLFQKIMRLHNVSVSSHIVFCLLQTHCQSSGWAIHGLPHNLQFGSQMNMQILPWVLLFLFYHRSVPPPPPPWWCANVLTAALFLEQVLLTFAEDARARLSFPSCFFPAALMTKQHKGSWHACSVHAFLIYLDNILIQRSGKSRGKKHLQSIDSYSTNLITFRKEIFTIVCET